VLYKKSTNGDMATTFVDIRPLDPDEVALIELFALGNFPFPNGLPVNGRPGTPPSDELLNRTQRYLDELEAAKREGKWLPTIEEFFGIEYSNVSSP
jgi:hypothetical protein